jgi:hypothetical protein
MTIDELITKIDNEPAKQENTEAPKVETPVEAPTEVKKGEDMLPIGQQFADYCESKKRK